MIIIVAIVAIPILLAIALYNSMVKLRNNRENAFADIDVQLRQRHDLIPQLVETVRGYAKHESSTLQAVTEARNIAMQASSIDEKIAAEDKLNSALQGLKVTIENYPDLKANQNFMHLQEEVADVENKLAASRRYFNSATKEFNTSIQTFPANIVAGMFHFHRETFFELGAERAAVSEAPKIQF
jgi:LemA protein